jgi:glycine cleavage system aminomethyltransferase T
VSLVLEDPQPMMWGGELVLRDGVPVGQVRSAAWSDTLGACVAIAAVWRRDGAAVSPDYLRSGSYAVDVAGDVFPATVHLRAPFDPVGAKIKR